MLFSDLGLSEKVLSAVSSAGYTTPTPIQAQAIPHILSRRDLIGIAQTGTGKTAAFTLPMLSLLESGRARARMPRTLILEPTRELAAQVEENMTRYGANQRLSVALLIGGVSFGDQDLKITRGVDVLIATPGRLLDHVERGKLLLSGIDILVIDEADRMLDMGFIPDIERICKLVPFTRQTLFFSATMPPEIQRLTENFLSNPIKVEVSRPASTASTITQELVASGSEHADKRDVLRHLIRGAEGLKNAIVFCNRKRDVAVLHRSLVKHGFNAGALHGDMDQMSRTATLERFRAGDLTLLIASDVAARGLDIPDVSHVFNYDVPHHAEDYVHRIGRTGRAGRSGRAVMLVTPDDKKTLDAIRKLIGRDIPWIGEPAPVAERKAGIRDRGGEARSPRGRRDERRREPRAGDEARAGTRPARSAEAAPPRPVRSAEPSPAPRAARVDHAGAPRTAPERDAVTRPSPIRPLRTPRPAPAPALDDAPAGLGEHVPAFLLRAVRTKTA